MTDLLIPNNGYNGFVYKLYRLYRLPISNEMLNGTLHCWSETTWKSSVRSDPLSPVHTRTFLVTHFMCLIKFASLYDDSCRNFLRHRKCYGSWRASFRQMIAPENACGTFPTQNTRKMCSRLRTSKSLWPGQHIKCDTKNVLVWTGPYKLILLFCT